MNFSKTTSYALSVLNYMSGGSREVYSASHLHKELCIPKQYLRQLLTDLSKNGLVKSSRGRQGGFVLGRETSAIFLADIIEAVEGLDVLSTCIMGFNHCPFDHQCVMHNTWADTRERITHILKTTSLATLKKPLH